MAYQPVLGAKGRKQKNMADLLPQDVCDYACEDADVAMRLKPLLEKDMQENGQETLFRDTEMPLMPVLAKMERHGVRLDTKALGESSRILNERLLRIEEEIY